MYRRSVFPGVCSTCWSSNEANPAFPWAKMVSCTLCLNHTPPTTILQTKSQIETSRANIQNEYVRVLLNRLSSSSSFSWLNLPWPPQQRSKTYHKHQHQRYLYAKFLTLNGHCVDNNAMNFHYVYWQVVSSCHHHSHHNYYLPQMVSLIVSPFVFAFWLASL